MRLLLVAYDNDSFISWFPQALGYLAAVCRKAGHEVVIFNQDVYHWPDDYLTAYLDREKFDMVGMGSCGGYYQYRKILNLCEAVNRSRQRPFLVLGEHMVSPEPEYFLRKTGADAIVIGEGEDTLVELLEVLSQGVSLESVKGIAFLKNNEMVKTPERELIRDVDAIPLPAWDLFPMDHYALLRMPHITNNERCMPVLSGRGCTFKCNFCYRMDQGFRPRKAEGIIDEIQRLKSDYAISYIAFSDELLMSSVERTEELCRSFIQARLNVKWDCNGRLNYAKPDLLRLMKEAGCVFINYGIESMDEKALRAMNKALTVKQITEGIENTLASGISPGYNIIFGNIGETKESLQMGVDFLLKYDDHSQFRTIRPVTPYPGCPLYYYAIEKGLLRGVEDFYENKHVNSDLLSVNFTDMTDQEFHRSLFAANKVLIENYFSHALAQNLKAASSLYLEGNTSFRGFRQS